MRQTVGPVRALTAAVVLAATALMPTARASADPAPPPTDPVPPVAEFVPQPSGIGNPLAQSGSQQGLLGLPDLSAYGPSLLLGQNPTPVEPGVPAPVAVPSLNAFDPQYLLGQNEAPAAPGAGTPAPGLGPDEDIPGTGRIAFLRRLYEMYQAGALRGSLLGQQSPDEFAGQTGDIAAPPPPP
jgi:hypothetical protein